MKKSISILIFMRLFSEVLNIKKPNNLRIPFEQALQHQWGERKKLPLNRKKPSTEPVCLRRCGLLQFGHNMVRRCSPIMYPCISDINILYK